jgi:hypothetical protein
MNATAEVEAWFAARKPPQEPLMRRVREVILAADPRVTESIKWSTPTFAYRGNIVSFNPAKQFVSLLFHRGAHIPGTHPRLGGSGDTARTMRFADLDELEAGADELTDVIRAWCTWRDTEG